MISNIASKVDSSSYIASTTQESTWTRGLTSTVWAHSRTALDGEDPAYRYCIHCTIDPIFKTKMASTNLQSHLKSKHAIFVKVTLGQIQLKALEQLKELYVKEDIRMMLPQFSIVVIAAKSVYLIEKWRLPLLRRGWPSI